MRLTPWSLTALILYFNYLQHSGIIVCGAINWAYFFWLHHTHGSFSSVHCNGGSLEAHHWFISSHCKHNFLLFCVFVGPLTPTVFVKHHQDTAELSRKVEYGCSNPITYIGFFCKFFSAEVSLLVNSTTLDSFRMLWFCIQIRL